MGHQLGVSFWNESIFSNYGNIWIRKNLGFRLALGYNKTANVATLFEKLMSIVNIIAS